LERVAAGVGVEMGSEPVADAPERIGRQELADQGVALRIELVEMGLHVHARDAGGAARSFSQTAATRWSSWWAADADAPLERRRAERRDERHDRGATRVPRARGGRQ